MMERYIAFFRLIVSDVSTRLLYIAALVFCMLSCYFVVLNHRSLICKTS